MTFAVWVILILTLLVIGLILTGAWRMRQKLQQSEHHMQEKDSMANNLTGQKEHLHGGTLSSNGTGDSVYANGVAKFSQITTQFSEQVSHKIQGFIEERAALKQPELTDQFRLWVTGAFDEEPEIRHWLGSLSSEQLEAYCSYLANFCQDMGFELDWLLDGRMTQEPKLSSTLEKIILRYSQASHQAVLAQQEVAEFNLLHEYLEDPVCRKNLALSQKIFGRLIEKGLAPVNISEHLTLSKREQTEQILQVIRTTATEYPETFKSIVTETMSEPAPLEHDTSKPMTDTIDNGVVVENGSQVLEAVSVSA